MQKTSIRQLQREIDQIKRHYDRETELLSKKAVKDDEIECLLQNASFETDILQEQIQIILSARLFHEANRLGIPSPRYTDADSDMWGKSHRGQVYLSLKAQSELRRIIRREKKERWEARAVVIRDIAVPITGLIGVITGLVAVFRR